jgi:aspartyl-tRNA(Asn)/glutamyl-tRNA(Gln) amidotransferase subunit A
MVIPNIGNLSSIEKVDLIKNKKLSAEENIKFFLSSIEKDDKKGNKINSFISLNPDALLESKEVDSNIRRGKTCSELKLAGLAVAVKSNINVKGLNATCASKTLQNYKCPYSATVIEKIKEQGGIVIGMTNMDEFACGSSGETSFFGQTKNPKCPDRIPGGSSSGSAAALSANFCDLSLGSDTGGSIRNPASHCGVIGFKPSYGVVSRYGLIDLAMSLDQIGIFAKSIRDVKLLFEVISGQDEKDATTISLKTNKNIKKLKIAFPEVSADKNIISVVESRLKEVCSENKFELKRTLLESINLGIQTYYTLNYAEFFSGTRKFDGRRYGLKIEDSCGEEVFRRIIAGEIVCGEEFSGRYYKKALEAKKIIKDEFDKLFKEYDFIVLPTVPKLPHKFGEKLTLKEMYDYDTLTVLANIAQLPAISLPCGEIQGIPIGLTIMAPHLDDFNLLDIAEKFEDFK